MSKDKPTLGTETSKYQEEKKIIMIPQVVASEKGIAQIAAACRREVVGPRLESIVKPNPLESGTIAGDSPVGVHRCGRAVS